MVDVSPTEVTLLPPVQLLAGFGWFNDLEPDLQQRVASQTHARLCEAGEFVARRGVASDYWIGVHQGLLKLAVDSNAGRGCTFAGIPSGGWFGEGSVLKREQRKYDVVALRPSVVLFLPADVFHELLGQSLSFSAFVIQQLNERMGEFIANIQNTRLLDVNARVARSLAQLFNPMLYPQASKALELSQEELALLAGMSRQRANKALQALQEEGLIHLAYNRIEIRDLVALGSYGAEQL